MRSRCIICDELTDTRRYAELRFLGLRGRIVQMPWYHRRICDECAPLAPKGSRVLVVVAEVLEAAPPVEQVGSIWNDRRKAHDRTR